MKLETLSSPWPRTWATVDSSSAAVKSQVTDWNLMTAIAFSCVQKHTNDHAG